MKPRNRHKVTFENLTKFIFYLNHQVLELFLNGKNINKEIREPKGF